jgi:hypothetical protein
MRNYLLIAGAAMSLTACGQSTPGASPTAAATDAGAAQPTRLVGEWEYTTQMKITAVSGVPAAMASQMQAASPPPQVRRECLSKPETRADIDKMFANGNNDCKFTKTAAPADKIAGTVACHAANGMDGTGTINGAVGPSDLNLTMALKSTMPSPVKQSAPATVQMLVTMTARRVGDCPK